MNNTFTTLALALGLGLCAAAGLSGCGDDAPTCDKVAEHWLDMATPEMKKMIGDKKALVERCEADLTPEQRTCAIDAKDLQAIAACGKK